MAAVHQPKKIEKALSLSGIARALDLSYPRAISLHEDGVLVPDFIGPNNTALFRASRLPELTRLIRL